MFANCVNTQLIASHKHDDVEIFASHFLLRTSDPFEFGHLRVAEFWKFPRFQDGMNLTCQSGECLV